MREGNLLSATALPAATIGEGGVRDEVVEESEEKWREKLWRSGAGWAKSQWDGLARSV